MARYDRQYDFGLRGYDRGYGRGYGYPDPEGGPGYAGYGPPRAHRGYDAAGFRPRGGYGPPPAPGWYDAGYRPAPGPRYGARPDASGGGWLPHHVTARYNADYVHPRGERRPVNFARFGGDVEGRVGDMTEYTRPYVTVGGTRTWRGGSQAVGWENAFNRARGYGGYGGYGGPGW